MKKLTYQNRIVFIGTFDECIKYREQNYQMSEHPNCVMSDTKEGEEITPVEINADKVADSHEGTKVQETQTELDTVEKKVEKLFEVLKPIADSKKAIAEIMDSISQDEKQYFTDLIFADERFAPYLSLIGS